jgi:hypothetical protein
MTITDPDVSRQPVELRPILLPDAGDGQRRRRRHERQRVVRQRWLAGGSVVVAAIAAVLLLRGTHTGTHTDRTPAPSVPVGVPVPTLALEPGVAPPSVLVQQVNSSRTASLVAFLPSAEGAGGTVLVFPATTSLSSVAANLPRHRAETIIALNDDQLAALLQPSGTLHVAVPGAASASVTPGQAPRFLSSGPGEALARQEAFWTAWLNQLKTVPAGMPTQAALAQALQVLVKGSWTVAVPPGTSAP